MQNAMYQEVFDRVNAQSRNQQRAARALTDNLVKSINSIQDRLFNSFADNEQWKIFFNKSFSKLEAQHSEIVERIQYRGSFAEFVDSCATDYKGIFDIFDFRSQKIPFAPRKSEMAVLWAFLQADDPVLWWGLVGPGGSGKSRLALELSKECNMTGDWKAIHIENPATLYKDWNHDFRYNKKLLIIIDDMSKSKTAVDAFLKTLTETSVSRINVIRLLLIERETPSNNGFPPQWFPQQHIHFCFGRSNASCLKLGPMNENSKRDILEYFSLLPSQITVVLSALKRIDPAQERVLYLLFLAEAAMRGSDVTDWNIAEVKGSIIEREKLHIQKVAQQIDTNSSDNLSILFIYLQALATVSGTIEWDEIQEAYAAIQSGKNVKNDFIKRMIMKSEIPELTLFRLTKELSHSGEGSINKFKPDLAGEFLIYHLVNECTVLSKQDRVSFLRTAWARGEKTFMMFLSNFGCDLVALLTSDNASIIGHWLFHKPENETHLLSYGGMLLNLTAHFTIDKTITVIEKLKELADTHNDQNLQVQYAKGLVNLSIKQDLPGCQDTVAALKALAARFEHNEEIQAWYAKGLVSLSIKQDLPGCQDTVAELKALAARFEHNEYIQAEYAKGLVSLSIRQDLPGRQDTVAALKTLAARFEHNEYIQAEYAKGLVCLIIKQDLPPGCQDTVAALKSLAARFEHSEEIQTWYAKGLVNLSIKQDLRVARIPLLR